MKKLCPLFRMKFFFHQDDTKIINFDEGVLILYGHSYEAMSFSKFVTSVSKVTMTYRKISIVWLPRVNCLLLL